MLKRTEDAIRIFQAAVAAVQPAQLLPANLMVTGNTIRIGNHEIPLHTIRRVYVIGAGKASAAMALETEAILGDLLTEGLVITKYGHSLPVKKIRIREAAHPVPDENGVQGVHDTLQLLKQATANDLVICLISGGASALWCDVPAGLSLHELQTTFDCLLKSGATIAEMNTVRKHLSGIKGGQLVRNCGGARVCSLLISDVPGDALEVIASGPTVPDATTYEDALTILSKYNLLRQVPVSIVQHLEKGKRGLLPETPKPGDALFKKTATAIIGTNRVALQAAGKTALSLGYRPVTSPDPVVGNAESAAQSLVSQAAACKGEKPVCILQGGETTVTVTGNGKGGRNQQLALAALYEMVRRQQDGEALPVTVLSGGTDGTDGPTDAAGAVVDQKTMEVAAGLDLSIDRYLNNHDAYHFFRQTGSLLKTGPTQTNVMDIMIALVNNP